MATTEKKLSFRDRIRQIGAAFTFTRTHDKLVVPLLLVSFFVPIVVALVVALISQEWALTMPLGIMLGVLAALIVFGRRVTKATYNAVEGEVGAAGRDPAERAGNWRFTPAVAITPQQDLVHRLVGAPGVVLVIEGSPARLKNLIVQEKKKKVGRVAPEIHVYDVVVGDEEGQVPLRKLQRHFVKMPRNITPKQVNAVEARADALGTAQSLPKGPLPKGARMPKGAKLNRGG